MASKRRIRRKEQNKSCKGKIPYDLEEEAIFHCGRLGKKYNSRLSAYKCKFCAKYHIGNTPKIVQYYADQRKKYD